MYTVILVAAIFAVFTFVCFIRAGYAGINLLFPMAISIIAGYGGAVFGALFAVYIGQSAIPSHEIIEGPILMQSASRDSVLRDSVSPSGNKDRVFIWGRRTSGKLIYHFHIGTEDNLWVPAEVPANGLVHIIEDPSLTGQGYWSATVRVMNRSLPAANWALPSYGSQVIVRQEFRVPVGTVIEDSPENR